MLHVSKTPHFARFRKEEDGVVAMTFAFMMFGLLMFMGLAVDLNMAYHASQRAGQALDAAAIAAAKQLRDGKSTPADVRQTAQRFFDENTSGDPGKKQGYATHKPLKVQQDATIGKINLSVDVTVPTAFARIAGYNEIKFVKSAEAIYDSKDIEVGLQLDVTGSMSGAKLAALKLAAGDLIDTLLPSNGPKPATKVRIGLAPFAAGVNAGPYANLVGQSPAPGGCIYERALAAAEVTDEAPVGLSKFLTRAQLPSAYVCPSTSIVEPLSDDAQRLKATINAYSADGWTAGHLGSSWAWYLLSPNWSGVWPTASRPASYGDKKTAKYAILMTDGNYNTYNGQPNQAANSEARARAICAGMKRERIVVYTIGFQLGNGSPAERLLKDCASSVGAFFKADDADALRAAFKSIAQQIGGLRLSQ